MNQQQAEQEKQMQERLIAQAKLIKNKILVLSGKGGVGKSTIAMNLAVGLAKQGHSVGLLDIDIHGPSIPGLLGMERAKVQSDGESMLPITHSSKVQVMSIGFLLEQMDTAVIWRGPKKYSVIRQFLADVKWGSLDYLIVDSPPGTGDEPLSIAQLLPDVSGAVIVTTPQKVAISDVAKSVTFCKQLTVPILGVIENMNGFVCPKCGEVTHIFQDGGGEQLAKHMGIPFLGKVPLDPEVVVSSEKGVSLLDHEASQATTTAFEHIVQSIK